MKRRKKDTMNDLLRLLNDFLDGSLIVPEVELPEVVDLKDYLHREDRILNLMKDKTPRELVVKGSLLEQIIAKRARKRVRRSLNAYYRSAIRQASGYVNKILVDIFNDVPGAVERLSEAAGLEFTKDDISIEEVSYPVAKHSKVKCLMLNKYSYKGRFSRDCKLCFYMGTTSEKLRKAVYSPKDDSLTWRKYLGSDMIAGVALFNAIMAAGKGDENKLIWYRCLAADAIRASKDAKERFGSANTISLTEKFLSDFCIEITDFIVDHPIDIDFVALALEYLTTEFRIEKNYREYYRKVAHTARAFETKRNIPEATIRQMANSKFNNYFGYIEFDESTNLDNADEVYKDFVAINDKFFGGLKAPDVSLRFRLLGRHHALGLYYPELSCMCVDVRSPSSFIHEYFHMYDYTNGELSRTYEFNKVREVYSRLITKWYESLSEDQKKRMGGSKYNLDYYLFPTEVFARCGEIYISRIKGVVNSCCKLSGELGFAYPENAELEELIAEYFDKQLPNSIKKDEEENSEEVAKVAAASDVAL